MTVASEASNKDEQSRRLYRAIWRWHFYAGIFSIPLILWLSLTGSIYLFKPQIERWLDRPYDHLKLSGQRATPEHIAEAAVAAVPNSSLHYYELPPGEDAAARVIVGIDKKEYRVYVDPQTLSVLNVADEDKRPMRILFHLHGDLMAGDLGSYVVELAASWAIVLVVSGLYLWWPRQTEKLAGVLWIRTSKGSRIFWRDLHAVTGVWVSAFALFLVLTGLPWAKGWGSYFKNIRNLTHTATPRQDWTTGRSSELAERTALNRNSLAEPSMEHAEHMGHMMHRMMSTGSYAPFDRLVPLAESLHLAAPVQIMPAMQPGGSWTIKSDSQNRPLRDVYLVNAKTGEIVEAQRFNKRMLIDRIVGTGVAAHEGQLFGLANQLLSLATALGLVLLSTSALVLWWRRRHVGLLGAPIPLARPRFAVGIVAVVLALALYLPAMACSLAILLLFERFVLSRIPRASIWLGLSQA